MGMQTQTSTLSFERVLRECEHNKRLTRDGASRGMLYDFKVLLDGQHIAWWYQYGVNGQTDTQGYRYWLRDKAWEIIRKDSSPYGNPIAARNQQEFESVINANLNRIPSDEELAQRKAAKDQVEAERTREQEANERRRRIEQAAPELLEALKEIVRVVGGTLQGYGVLEAPMRNAENAIAKAEGPRP